MTVYFARFEDRGRWKIGYTAGDSANRLRTSLTFTPCKVWIEAAIDGDQMLENDLHSRFQRQRVLLEGRSEIYETSDELERLVAHLKDGGTILSFDIENSRKTGNGRALTELKRRIGSAERELVRDSNSRAKKRFLADQAAWNKVLAEVESTVTNAWWGAECAYDMRPLAALPVDNAFSSCGMAHWRAAGGGSPHECSERAGVRRALLFLMKATTQTQLMLAWTAFAVHEALFGVRRCGSPGFERLEAVREVACAHLGALPEFHHSCSQLFPEPFPADLRDETESVAGITRLARIHLDHCLRKYRAVKPMRVRESTEACR